MIDLSNVQSADQIIFRNRTQGIITSNTYKHCNLGLNYELQYKWYNKLGEFDRNRKSSFMVNGDYWPQPAFKKDDNDIIAVYRNNQKIQSA